MRLRAVALLMLALAVSTAPLASAELYSNAQSHYHFTSPSGWARQSYTGVDVVYAAPSSAGGFTPNMNALHAADRTAKNDVAYLETTAASSLSQLQTQLSGTVVQAARPFTAGSGRLAADYVLDYMLSGTQLRIRQVIFGSDILDMGWVITFTAAQSVFGDYASEWDSVTDSFGVDAEVASGLSLPYFVVIGAVVGAGVGGVMFLVVRRKHARALAAVPAVAPMAPVSQTQPPVYAQVAPGAPAPPQPRPASRPGPRPPRTGGP